MNDSDLNELLKTASLPERSAEYWKQFPSRVTREILCRERSTDIHVREPRWASRALLGMPALLRFPATGFVMVICSALIIIFALHRRHYTSEAANDPQLLEAQKYYHEIESLFPNQVQAIVLDKSGPRLVLAKNADVPQSPPLYLKICQPAGCQRFITFSGQQIQLNGELCDVLTDREGHVLLVGRETVWSSSVPGAKAGSYRLEAKPLGGTT
jgi:hypothetical protein